MSSQEEVERKVDAEAEGEPGRRAADVAAESEFESSGHETTTGVGGFLTDLSVGSLPSLSLAVLLFGGLVLLVAGATGYVMENYGLYPTLAVLGFGSIVVAYVLAQVYARRGWI